MALQIQNYDVIIIGGGPAGLTAGLYSSRDRLKSLLIEKQALGGQIASSEWVENYPGFPEGVNGFELGQLMQKQALKYGLETVTAEVTALEIAGSYKIVHTTEGDFRAPAVIIAGGADRRKLEIPGEKEYTGRGVSYCATCDGAFFRERHVAVIGGGNAAVSEALHLAKFASRVTLIHRGDKLRATPVLQERVRAEKKIEVRWNTTVERINGGAAMTSLELNDGKTGSHTTLQVEGVFVSIGIKPNTVYLSGLVALDSAGYVVTNQNMETGVPGILAAGDIRAGSIRQTVTAAGDGAAAAVAAGKFLAR
jgi:thioredoxin reductase (NADPH)